MKPIIIAAKNTSEEESALGKPITVPFIEANENGEPLTDEDGKTIQRDVVFLPPTSSQIVLFMAGASDTSSQTEAMTTGINLFFDLIENDDDHRWLKSRLWNRDDPFTEETIGQVMEGLTAEWFARPTKQPSDYLPSQTRSGSRSTQRRHRATSTP